MLLLITGSSDGTSDLLIDEIGSEKVFRFNFDLFNDYKLEFKPDYWRITNPTGHSIDSDSVTSCFWWKAFNFYLVDQEQFIVEEVKYIFREIYHWCRLRGLTIGTPHDFHNHMGKMNLLSIASKYFKTPATLTTFNLEGVNALEGLDVVAKSFTSGLTETNKALATTAVDKAQLHPNYPWFLQEKIVSKADITIFICGNEYFAYSRDRSELKGLDWRMEQDYTGQKKEWFRIKLSPKSENAVCMFCKDVGVDWGRMDLMEVDGELIFLEFNANGQWVFLDYSGEDSLVKSVANYLMKKK
jgi:hypothetical protein